MTYIGFLFYVPQRVMAHPDVSYRIEAMDEDMGIVLFRLDFGNTSSYGLGNDLALFEAFKIHVCRRIKT